MNIWLFCLYIAVAYSCFRGCLTADKPKPAMPAIPPHFALLGAVFWPLFFLFGVGSDIWKGIKEALVKTQ